MVRRPGALAVVLAALLTVTGMQGTAGASNALPSPPQLVRSLLAAISGVGTIASRITGDTYLCEVRGRVSHYIGRARPGCRRATVMVTETLTGGRVQGEFSTFTARGSTTFHRLDEPSGRYASLSPVRCWGRLPSTGSRAFKPFPPFVYSGERLSVGRRGALLLLRGTSRGFSEVDTIDPTSHLILAIVATSRAHGVTARTVIRFSYRSSQTSLPAPSPLC